MSATESPSLAEERLQAAAEWLLRLREEPTNTELVTAWLQWCQTHPDNARAFSEIEEVWTLSGAAGVTRAHAAELQDEHYLDKSAVATLQPAAVDRANIATRRANTLRRSRWTYVSGLAATLALAVLLWRGDFLGHARATEYTTAPAVERAVSLADGSTVTLGGASAVRVVYLNQERDLQLLRGEAYFKVQHDAHRPFIVRAPSVAVKAVGTAFDVRADDSRTVVIVTQGVVEIRPTAARLSSTQRSTQSVFNVAAGQQVSVETAGDALAIQLSEAPQLSDWREGMLSFVDEPLRSVIARVNRYSKHAVLLADPALGELHFTGTVFRDRISDWALGLTSVFPVQANTAADGSITLLAKSDSSNSAAR